jgi:peptidyl-prolyl cis-trans isomerase B (cyclophilin B)
LGDEIIKVQFAKLILAAVTTLCCITDAHAQGGDPIVVLQTSRGPIAIRVYRSMVPRTANNFLDLVSRGFYNGLTFHRIETWCIQGGDPLGNGQGDFTDPQTGQPRYLNLEISPRLHHNAPGVVAMARSNNPNSASCQFYITKSRMGQLDGQYAIFGGVVDGMNAVNNMGRGDRILSAQIVDNGSATPQQGMQPSMQPRRGGGGSTSNAGTPTDSGF